ncbi:MAG: cytochrome P450 [Roseovarius sp.]
MSLRAPKPPARAERVTLWRYLRLFRQDILSAQPARLYRAWMAEFRTPFFRSYLCNDPALVDLVLRERPEDFPKSARIREGLRPLLGNSVFLTNGETWRRQRRIIDPAFEGGRLRDSFAAMAAAGQGAVARLAARADGQSLDIEEETSHVAADVIFRTLFSIPIGHDIARQVFAAFRAHQRAQPVLNLGAFLPLPRWFPRFHRPQARATAARIRRLITRLTEARMAEIAAGGAPDDLATKIMTTADPETGRRFDTEEMVDQVAIFFLAGHETSASALAWALALLALDPDWQERVAAEAAAVFGPAGPVFADMGRLRVARDVFRETLRLYPPVPMMVREARRPECLRGRAVRAGSQIVLSPWHLHRHERLWERPDEFDPARFESANGRACLRNAYIPFSAGPRVCTGAGFAMIEGPLILAMLVRAFRIAPDPAHPPMPVAHLTVRGRDGIRLRLTPRDAPKDAAPARPACAGCGEHGGQGEHGEHGEHGQHGAARPGAGG